jgi:hypothetical protein
MHHAGVDTDDKVHHFRTTQRYRRSLGAHPQGDEYWQLIQGDFYLSKEKNRNSRASPLIECPSQIGKWNVIY